MLCALLLKCHQTKYFREWSIVRLSFFVCRLFYLHRAHVCRTILLKPPPPPPPPLLLLVLMATRMILLLQIGKLWYVPATTYKPTHFSTRIFHFRSLLLWKHLLLLLRRMKKTMRMLMMKSEKFEILPSLKKISDLIRMFQHSC